MEFLKKNYEKVVMGLVLLGLVVGAAFLPIMISGERRALEERMNQIIERKPEELPALDLERYETLLARERKEIQLDFSSTNKLFNSVPWKRTPDGNMFKEVEGSYGPTAVQVTKITPLYTTLSFDTVSTTESGSRYMIGVTREAAEAARDRRKRPYVAEVGVKNEIFTLREVKGPPDNPSELVIEMADTGEVVSVTREKPFQRVDGHMADLRYEPEKRNWPARRVGMMIPIAGEAYNIVAINENEVVLSAKQNNKKTVIAFGD